MFSVVGQVAPIAPDLWPHTANGWVGLIVGILTIVSISVGVTARIARGYITNRIDLETKKMDQALQQVIQNSVRESITSAMEPIQLQLTTMNGEMERIRKLESVSTRLAAKLENGMTERQERIEDKVDKNTDRLERIVDHLVWDGKERRAT